MGTYAMSLGLPAWVRFWSKVNGGSVDQCWIWTTQPNNSYATFAGTTAHRYAYESLIGPVPDGLQLDHLCRTPKCVNPWHLEPVTGSVNVKRGMDAIPEERRLRRMQATCRWGHHLTRSPNGSAYCAKCRAAKHQRAMAKRAAA